jgi:amino acid efflux transporter
MSKPKKLSLLEAIFINTNIMLGTGTFVNTAMLAKTVGALGGFLYLGAGFLMLPLSFCFARLATICPGGTFYAFGSSLGRYWGFISTWSYFFGKLASASLSIHVFITFLQKIIPALQVVPTTWLDCLLIGLFISLNLLDVKTGGKIQYLFLSAKIIPILFVIFAGLHYANIINIQAPHLIWDGIPVAIPLMLFCFLGFEATCSLSRVVEEPEKNIPRAIIISFCLVLSFIFLYQTIFYMSMGSALGTAKSYVDIFPLLLTKVIPSNAEKFGALFSTTIGIAALGGAYGILYSNPWNLYTLAEQRAIPYAAWFAQLNRYSIPYICVITEGILCCCYILWLKGAQVPLQYTAVLGCIVTYTISVLGLLTLERSLLGMLGLMTCCITTFFCIRGFIYTDTMPLVVLGLILAFGSITYLALRQPRA